MPSSIPRDCILLPSTGEDFRDSEIRVYRLQWQEEKSQGDRPDEAKSEIPCDATVSTQSAR